MASRRYHISVGANISGVVGVLIHDRKTDELHDLELPFLDARSLWRQLGIAIDHVERLNKGDAGEP